MKPLEIFMSSLRKIYVTDCADWNCKSIIAIKCAVPHVSCDLLIILNGKIDINKIKG